MVFNSIKVLALAMMAFSVHIASCTESNPIYNNECVKKCVVTSDYTPFCGSDNQTYPTNDILGCFQDCRIQITKAYDGECKAKASQKNPIFDDPCVKKCQITADYTPFCGSDNQDYPTKGYLTCFTNCKKPITMAHEGKCQELVIVTENPIFNDQCVKTCPITDDFTPFCGSDNQDYPTKSYLGCFQRCQKQITKVHDGLCQQSAPVQQNPIFNDPCVKNCAITQDYSPFCGSDNQEYPTKSYLGCFQTCHKQITKAYDGKCRKSAPIEQNPIFKDPCVQKCPITDDLSPFCGSDNQDYPTKSYLNCFTNCKKPITLAHEGKCH
ncbi:serine protease inhibitor dipetalogastin-like [Planococcus citri]|uniref:serine protease inhibitor dipetalogastin-like n=1 Tax=Planococcus citri TaxID=170843 RepID=UPI0031F87E5A